MSRASVSSEGDVESAGVARPKKFVIGNSSNEIFMALQQAGVFEDDPRLVRRVVIDLEVGAAARIYVERFADERLIDVFLEGAVELVLREEGQSAGEGG